MRILRDVVFLGATRNAKLEVYPAPTEAEPVRADVGSEGEYAPWWYVQCADDKVDPARAHPNEQRTTVRGQIDAWINELFPGAAANAEAMLPTGLTRLEFKTGRAGAWAKPANVGYGLGYAFPLIVALTIAAPGQVVVVDSPEAHLHPRAQSQMGRMLAFFAAAGVQVIVETHSDHVLSGIRLSIKEGGLPGDRAAIHFFSGVDAITPGVTTLSVDRDGNLDAWPEGFFDQADRDLSALASWVGS
jgi:predicted ATPase